MSAAFDRDALLDAFDSIGRAAAEAGTKLQIAVYGGSALMLASNFRFATEGVSDHGPGSGRCRAPGYFELDESGWNIDCGRGHRAARTVFSGQRSIIRETALPAEEHGRGGRS